MTRKTSPKGIHKWSSDRDSALSHWSVHRIRPGMPIEDLLLFLGIIQSSRNDLPATILLKFGPGDYVLREQTSDTPPVGLGQYGLRVCDEGHSDVFPWELLCNSPNSTSKSTPGRPLDENITRALEMRAKGVPYDEILKTIDEKFDQLSEGDKQQRRKTLISAVSKRRKKSTESD